MIPFITTYTTELQLPLHNVEHGLQPYSIVNLNIARNLLKNYKQYCFLIWDDLSTLSSVI